MEILLVDSGGKTAVSIYHHTRRFFILTGVMCGDILESVVDSLMMSLKEKSGIA